MHHGPQILSQWNSLQDQVSAGKMNEVEARESFDAWLEGVEVLPTPSSRP